MLTAGADAVSITRFHNESDIGGATATHVVLSANFPTPGVIVKSIRLFVNDSLVFSNPPPNPAANNPCTPPLLTASTVPKVSCAVGSIAGDGTAKLVVRFSTSTAMTVTGTADYGEGGNDSLPPRPNGTVNDTQSSVDTLTIAGAGSSTAAQGGCFDTIPSSIGGSTGNQTATASFGQADSSLGLPCSPASAGVDTAANHRPNGFVPVSFAEFMKITGGTFGTFTVDYFFQIPKGFVLKELTGPDPTDAANSWTNVPTSCQLSGLPPSGRDVCIFGTKNLPKGGMEFTLHVIGSDTDPKVAG